MTHVGIMLGYEKSPEVGGEGRMPYTRDNNQWYNNNGTQLIQQRNPSTTNANGPNCFLEAPNWKQFVDFQKDLLDETKHFPFSSTKRIIETIEMLCPVPYLIKHKAHHWHHFIEALMMNYSKREPKFERIVCSRLMNIQT